jgi:hypothetical protein
VPRKELRDMLIRLISLLRRPGPTAEVLTLPQPELQIPQADGKA